MPTAHAPDAAAPAADDDLVCRAFAIRAVREGARECDFVASTDAVDSYGEIVEQDWDLARYKANPVALYNHSRYGTTLPIGHATKCEVEEGTGLVCTLRFVTAEANPLAEQVWQSIRQKSLRAVSVGFRPRDVRRELRDGKEVYVLSDNELHEISVVPIPANPEALARFAARAAAGRAAPPPTTETTTTTPAAPPPAKETPTMKFLALLAALGIAAKDEAEAESKVTQLAGDAVEQRKALGLPPGAPPADVAAKLSQLSADAAKVPALEARVKAHEDAAAARAEAERVAYLDALCADGAMKAIRPSLEFHARADWEGFRRAYPLPKAGGDAAKLAAENAALKALGLQSRVAPAAGAPAAPVAVPQAPVDHAELARALAAELKSKNPQLGDEDALRQASKQLATDARGALAAVRQ